MKTKILLVEDEKTLSEVITMNLELEGYMVQAINNGVNAIAEIQANFYDLILLDVMLPGMNGFEICKLVREQNKQTPILILSAKSESNDKITGLSLGADDYLAKPFDLRELLLRVKALLKRTMVDSSHTINFGKNSVDLMAGQAYNGVEYKTLTKLEKDLLQLLISRQGQVVSRKDILSKVWGYDVQINTRTLDNFILGFRKFFEEDSRNPRHFQSVWGVGYKFLS